MSLVEKIAEDMRKSGFPLEIEIGSQLSNDGWTVNHQVAFRDQEENKSRCIDIQAHKVIYTPFFRYNRLNCTMICECKKSEKPWVFHAPTSDILHERDLATAFYLKYVSWPQLLPKDYHNLPSLVQNHYVSKDPIDRLAQAHYVAFSKDGEGKGLDQVFTATNQVIKATLFYIASLTQTVKLLGSRGVCVLMIVYPMIVFDGNMFQCLLDEKKEPRLEEVQYTKYRFGFVGQSEEVGEQFLIDVVRKDFLPQYTHWLEDEMKALTNSKPSQNQRRKQKLLNALRRLHFMNVTDHD